MVDINGKFLFRTKIRKEKDVIQITITGERLPKKALVYEFPQRGGRRKFVPCYRAFCVNTITEECFDFSVVRDCSPQVFGAVLEDPYGEDGECPPCDDNEPFWGVFREDGPKGFRIQLFEPKLESSCTVVGRGTTPRDNIQIHFGAAASHGCILVAGSRRSYFREFAKRIRRMDTTSGVIRVMVHPRR